jgi:hypothetical protein
MKQKIFASAAFLKVLEKNLYGLYRSILVELDELGPDGKPIREKVKDVGPISLLREARKGEEDKVVLRSHHPKEDRELALVEAK